ncbi:hypothetical protein PM082_023434 [Marasmius tenuissimus]|nr:hypothetical protein PM082_023434 [Marasmius tenuissimus]
MHLDIVPRSSRDPLPIFMKEKRAYMALTESKVNAARYCNATERSHGLQDSWWNEHNPFDTTEWFSRSRSTWYSKVHEIREFYEISSQMQPNEDLKKAH